jgi:hypothetical protein
MVDFNVPYRLTLVISTIVVVLVLFTLNPTRKKLNDSEFLSTVWPKKIVNVYPSWVTEFKERECRIYSQNGEDGVLLWIFANIGTVNHPPHFVEFGTESGSQCNTRFLRQHLGWQGLLMDGSHQDASINLHREIITAANINDLFTKYQVPKIVDLLSIDVE